MDADLTMYLSSGARQAKLSAEKLEMLGKEAASMLLDQGLPLNKAVVKLASAIPDINQDQVCRVCEFANTAAYLAKHDFNKTAGIGSSYPQFDLADPLLVLEALEKSASPSRTVLSDVSYSRAPAKTKTSRVALDQELEKLFLGEEAGREKTASVEDPSQELLHTKSTLDDVSGVLSQMSGELTAALEDRESSYYNAVKDHLLDKGSFGDIVYAATGSGHTMGKVAGVLMSVVDRLLSEHVVSPEYLDNGAKNFEKLSHRILNEDHVFVQGVKELVDLQDEIEKVSHTLIEVEAHRNEVRASIKELFLVH